MYELMKILIYNGGGRLMRSSLLTSVHQLGFGLAAL